MPEKQIIKKAIDSGITPFAVTTFRNREKVFGIKTDDRRRHVYLIGKTGMGKTTLIENMVYSDIMAGHGVCYVDPHGDTAEKMLEWIPSNRINDVIYFNPADLEFPISFNVLEKVSSEHRHLISSGLIGVFKKLWADSWGPRLEYILRNAILALLEYPDSTLLGINRLLVDKEYRKKVVSKISDPVVRSFWVDEFPKWNERVLQEVISPIQNKVGQFLSTSLIRNVVGQVKSSIDLRKVMDDQKILILNLSKGRIGEDASALLGAMMVTKIQLAAMSRVNIPEDERNDFYLYVDEFQNFATDSFADILSEARKYRLNLIIAHQYIEQLGEVVQPAVFGNVGTLIVFRIGAADAEFLEKEFDPYLIMQDLVSLPKYHIYIKLMIDGVSSDPFSAKGLPPVYSESLGNEEKVIGVSRERYAKPRDIVEDKIRRWSETRREEPQKMADGRQTRGDWPPKKQDFTQRPTGAAQPQARSEDQRTKPQKAGNGFSAVCAGCKQEIEVPFKPDNIRPVFCKDCLKKARRGEIKIDKTQPVEAKEKADAKENEVSLSQIAKQTVDFKGHTFEAKEKRSEQRPPKKAASMPARITPPPVRQAAPAPARITPPPVRQAAPAPVNVTPQPVKKEEKSVQKIEEKADILEQKIEEIEEEKQAEEKLIPQAAQKAKMPSVDFLAGQGDEKDVQEGEVIEL